MTPIQPQDFLYLTYPANLSLSPDKTHCAWLEFTPDLAGNTYSPRLVCSACAGAAPSVLSCFMPPSSFTWEDSSHLLYISVHDGHTWLHRIDLSDGSDRPAGSVSLCALSVHFIKADCLLFLVRESMSTCNTQEASIFDEIPFWANGRGITNGQRTRLYLWNFKSLTPITPPNTEIGVVSVSKDEILYSIRYCLDKKMKFAALCRYDLASGTVTELIKPDKYDIFCAQRAGDSLFVCATDMDTWGNIQNPDFYLILDGGMKKLLSPAPLCPYPMMSPPFCHTLQ